VIRIPDKFQVFETPCLLDNKDEERLLPFLSGWKRLAPLLALGVNEPDLKTLIMLELLGKQRRAILDRLLSRLGRVQRHLLEKRINQALK
jgi:hypothetical protein